MKKRITEKFETARPLAIIAAVSMLTGMCGCSVLTAAEDMQAGTRVTRPVRIIIGAVSERREEHEEFLVPEGDGPEDYIDEAYGGVPENMAGTEYREAVKSAEGIGDGILVESIEEVGSIRESGDSIFPEEIETAENIEEAGDDVIPEEIGTAENIEEAGDDGLPEEIETAESIEEAGDDVIPEETENSEETESSGPVEEGEEILDSGPVEYIGETEAVETPEGNETVEQTGTTETPESDETVPQKVYVVCDMPEKIETGSVAVLRCIVEGYMEGAYTLQWQYCPTDWFGRLDGEWVDKEGATGSELEIVLDEETVLLAWRAILTETKEVQQEILPEPVPEDVQAGAQEQPQE